MRNDDDWNIDELNVLAELATEAKLCAPCLWDGTRKPADVLIARGCEGCPDGRQKLAAFCARCYTLLMTVHNQAVAADLARCGHCGGVVTASEPITIKR